MNLKPLLGFVYMIVILAFNSCETDDVEPQFSLTFSASNLSISEASGTSSIIATLNKVSEQAVAVELVFQGSATENVDYTINSKTLSIPAGSLIGSIEITALQDTLKEGNENIAISIVSAQGAKVEGTSTLSITLEDDDVAATAQFIINEVLYDPSNTGLEGDANQDGVYSQDGDSFIEFYNPSASDFDMGGYEVWDDTSKTGPHFVIPNGTIIPSKGVLVIFGEDLPNPSGDFGGATVISAGAGTLNFNNSGEVIGIKEPSGSFILTFDSDALSNNPNESYTRNPDLTGPFEQHSANTSLLFSPGKKNDGSPF